MNNVTTSYVRTTAQVDDLETALLAHVCTIKCAEQPDT